MATDTSGYVTVAEAAKRLGLSEDQVRRRLRAGKLRGHRMGSHWLVEESLPRGDEHLIRPRDPFLSDEFIASIDRLRRDVAAYTQAQGNPPVDVLELIRQHREEA